MRKLVHKKEIVVSSIATIFLILLYALIFTFSEQDGEASGGLSRMISERCVAFLNFLSGKNWTELMMKSMAEYFENPIRKIAHFCEYAVMGVLLFGIWYPWLGQGGRVGKEECEARVENGSRSGSDRKNGFSPVLKISIPWVFVSAALDEFHQLFVPGRYGCFADVLLDTAGGCFGLLCCIGGVKWYLKRKRKKKAVE